MTSPTAGSASAFRFFGFFFFSTFFSTGEVGSYRAKASGCSLRAAASKLDIVLLRFV